jgi:hypothetical protein
MRTRTLAGVLSVAVVVLFGTGFIAGSVHGSLPPMLIGVCVHSDASQYTCPDTSRRLAATGEVRGAVLTVEFRGGRTQRMRLPAHTDAVFFTRESVQKFLRRYYEQEGPRPRLDSLDSYLNRKPNGS